MILTQINKNIMKIIFLSLLISLVFPTEDISGIWNTGRDNTKIEIYKKDSEYFGEIISSDNTKAKKGTLIIRNFTYQEDKWKGKFYSLRFDKLIDAEISIDNNILSVTVYSGFKSKTVEWEKQ